MNKPQILFVEDDTAVGNLIATTLETQNYQFHRAKTGAGALMDALSYRPDVMLLDLGLPDMDGIEIIKKIRSWSNLPIIVVSARGEDADKIIGFECGADDYLTKPFNILELKARVRALLRRAGAAQQQRSGNELAAGHIILNTGERTASRDGVSVELTAKEFDLMELLMRNPGRVYSRENLLNVVWGYEYIGDYRTVDVHVRRLREKLELDPANPEYIRTKWGVGYYLSSRPVSAAPSK